MSSNLCPSSCSILASTFSGTLTSGIQDISALLPLLGTEQCEDHVSSALTKGYLYAAASPMSLFGSLGLVRAGFKTFLAGANFSISKLHFNGAQILSNMGFQPQGANLSLIMADKQKKGQYVVESRLDTFLEELHLYRNTQRVAQDQAMEPDHDCTHRIHVVIEHSTICLSQHEVWEHSLTARSMVVSCASRCWRVSDHDNDATRHPETYHIDHRH